MQRDMRRLEERIESMERKNHSDNSNNNIDEEEESSDEVEDPKEVKVLKMLIKSSSKTRVEVHMYEGTLNDEELMDWINALNK